MATIYSPTKYGPVPVYTQNGTTAIDSQTQGTISKLVAQPNNDSYPSVDSSGKWKYVERYVGPTSVVKDLPEKAFWIGSKRDEARARVGSSMFVDRFSAPDLPNGYVWVVDSVAVRQQTAGDKSEIVISYVGSDLTMQPGSGWNNIADENAWSLEWQPYSVSPYAFCKNDMIPDKSPKEKALSTDTASRYNIEQFLNQKKVDLSGWTYLDDQNKTKVLNQAEQLICKKVISNVNCQWHYPVITHNTSMYTVQSNGLSVITPPVYPGEVGGVDFTYEDDASCLSGMPFKFLDVDYKWVKIDDSVNGYKEGQKFTYRRQEKFMGVVSADPNYYGIIPFSHLNLPNCRWEIGEL